MSERKSDYPTGNPSGMSFISNRWVFTGQQGYRVEPDGDVFKVVSYTAIGTAVLCNRLPEDDAHALAARLATPSGGR